MTRKKIIKNNKQKISLRNEVILVSISTISIFMFLSNINLCGAIGEYIKNYLFFLFGIESFIVPFLIIILFSITLDYSNNNKLLIYISFIFFIFSTSSLIELFFPEKGGVVAIFIVNFLMNFVAKIGSIVILFAIWIISIVFLTRKPIFSIITKKSLDTGDKIGKEALEKAKNASTIFSNKVQNLRVEHKKNTINNIPYENMDNQIQKNFDIKNDSSLKENISLNLFRSNTEAIANVKDIGEDFHFNNDIQKPYKELVENEKKFNKINIDNSIDNIKSIESASIFNNDAFFKPFDNKIINDEKDYLEKNDTYNSLKNDSLHNYDDTNLFKNDYVNEIKQKDVVSKNIIHKKIDNFEQTITKNINKKQYKFPPLNILNKNISQNKIDKTMIQNTAFILQNTLEQFGVGAKVINVSIGPCVTRFELQPEIGVRVSKITSLEDDLKLALAAKEIRIEAPIPGKQAIGIEIPNKENSVVYIGDIINSKEFKESKSKLTIALGKDVSGNNIIFDLAKMPHILIAGATGSGKSICINSIIVSLIYKATPDEVKLLMIDPKVVELQSYNGIPHLQTEVITDPNKAKSALNWAVAEMTRRYQIFSEANVKDLEGYNSFVLEYNSQHDEIDHKEKMPQFVIIIDELADLMMVASKEVENSIVRIAQLARACGMHLVVATQRPMASVVTGLIKANIPSRIAFAVSSGLDSRIILDMQGAEKLLGKGDMLFSPSGSNQPLRVQGGYVSEIEINKIIHLIREEKTIVENEKKDQIKEYITNEDSNSSYNDLDELFYQCGKLAIDTNQASAGNFQRKFKIGFNRAARIIDELEKENVVGIQEGKKPREVLMSLEEFNQKFKGE
ncbi:MAG: DNA translocase FtsK [Eubacteriales bacterium]|nr:DNA translocase FtsK [Eubacteriales bacterium]